MKNLRYPIGNFNYPDEVSKEMLDIWKEDIKVLPSKIETATKDLPTSAFKHCYRPGSWNISQVIHHLTESHTNSYIRFKWTLTEDNPTIKAYDESKWALTQDAIQISPMDSLSELKVIQQRLYRVISHLTESDLKRTLYHPEAKMSMSLMYMVGQYAWHGNHHLEHIKMAILNPARDYVPIDCNFYDELVLLAMQKQVIDINEKSKPIFKAKIKDLITEKKSEYLVLDNGIRYRLDQIVKLENNALYIQ